VKILIVEDHVETGKFLVNALKQKNFVSELLHNGYEALYAMKSVKYDLVLLDIDLPYITGLDLLQRVRKLNISVPIIAVSALCGIKDKIAMLDAGADDYITKPFDHRELISRVEAVNRRGFGSSSSVIRFGNITVNYETQSVYLEDGKLVHLTRKEYTILELLLSRKPSVVCKEVFLSHLYHNVCDEPNPKIIDVFVCKLRKKLIKAAGDHYETPKIKTVWGRGYMIYIGDSEIDTQNNRNMNIKKA
jgi:two-component system cell cycle response regulator CtrA